ncbi:MAG TPA: glycosyltransferase [Candidatus Saccharimonadales bacterium]|nr:glycosyltransferase [Candidatus Saccharimonadales bacterium]
MKVVSITCYFNPDYVRTQVLEQALHSLPEVELIPIHNTKRGAGRYPEILWKLLKFKFSRTKPDVYLLNFRGYELLPLVVLLAGRKPIVYDEFINPVEVLAEHRKQKDSTAVRLAMGVFNVFATFYYWLLRRCNVILMDTEAHAVFTAHESGLPPAKYKAIPVSTNEAVFTPQVQPSAEHPKFQVFYYGSMVPLHGAKYVVEAAKLLQDEPEISFLIVGKSKTAAHKAAIDDAVANGARITYKEWIDFNDLPQHFADSAICVGGPFGDTPQSRFVVTGKTYQILASQAVVLVGQNQATRLFQDKQNALVVPQADAKAIAESIRWAYQNQDQLPAIAKTGRALYDQHFSNAIVAQDLHEILTKLH